MVLPPRGFDGPSGPTPQGSRVKKLNLGCGPVHAEGWENVDVSRRAWIAAHLGWLNRLLTRLRIWTPSEFASRTKYAD